jgi:hypothetical protein
MDIIVFLNIVFKILFPIMRTFLFKVEATFLITGRDLVVTSGAANKTGLIKAGMEIDLIRPDGSEVRTIVKGISFERNQDLLIPLMKEDVPAGTEIWTID